MSKRPVEVVNPTTYVQLSESGMRFFLLNMLAHDLSHDFTKQRVNEIFSKIREHRQSSVSDVQITDEHINEINQIDTIQQIVEIDDVINNITREDDNVNSLIAMIPDVKANINSENIPLTRARVKLIQFLDGFVSEIKMNLIGAFKWYTSGGNRRTKRTKRTKMRSWKNKKMPGLAWKNKTKSRLKYQSIASSAKNKPKRNVVPRPINDQIHELIMGAFHQLIGETTGVSGFEELNKYYCTYLQLYLSFESSDSLTPLDIFNLDCIHNTLILYLMRDDKVDASTLIRIVLKCSSSSSSSLEAEAEAASSSAASSLLSNVVMIEQDGIRNTKQTPLRLVSSDDNNTSTSMKTDETQSQLIPNYDNNTSTSMKVDKSKGGKGKIKGGSISSDFLDKINDNEITTNFKNEYNNKTAINVGKLDVLKHFVTDLINENVSERGLKIKVNAINNRLNTIKINEAVVQRSSSNTRRAQYVGKTNEAIYTHYLKILFEDLYDGYQRVVKNEAAQAALKATAVTMSTPLIHVADRPCKIVTAISKGLLKFAKINEVTSRQPSNDDILFNQQYQIVKELSESRSQGGDTLDNRIIEIIKEYAKNIVGKNNKDYSIFYNNQGLSNATKGKKYNVISNAASNSLKKLEISEIICPLSSILDSMGTFGSCYQSTTVSPSEQITSTGLSLSTDVFLHDYPNQNYYSGRISQDTRKSILEYTLKYGEFILPQVVKTIDTSTPNVTDLCVSNTYKSMVNRILFIWADKILEPRLDGTVDVNALFEHLIQNESVFSDILSCSSLKNAGDLYQELNGTLENRGYDMSVLDDKTRQTRIGEFKNKMLLEINQDRPSAARAIFLLLQNVGEINTNSITGYLSPSDSNSIFIQRN